MKLDWFELVQKSSQNRHNLDVDDTPTPVIISVTTGYIRPYPKVKIIHKSHQILNRESKCQGQ